MVDFNFILNAARQLTDEDQQRLIDELRPVSPEMEAELDDYWKAEIERRVARMEAGETKSVPWEQVRTETRRQLGLPDGD